MVITQLVSGWYIALIFLSNAANVSSMKDGLFV